MPQLAADSVQVLSGKIVLTKRSNSPKWQARYKVGNKWIRTSTGSTDVNEAEAIATRAYYESTIKYENDQPIVTRKFKSLAEVVKQSLQKELDAGTGKSVYADYIQAIDNWLIPFFGNHNVATIDAPMLYEFNEYRKEQLGREPACSTINTHTSALNRVFDAAVEQGYVNALHVPKIKHKKNGNKISRRPDFDLAEYHKLARFLQHWVKRGRNGKGRQMRYLLRDYIFILANSGIRHGTEATNLRWNQIEVDEDGYITFNVDGKTGPRAAITRGRMREFLERIIDRSETLSGLTLEQAIKTDEFVIALPNGEQTNHLGKKFEAMLTEADMLMCPRSRKKRTLYSMRHFYISQSLRLGRMTMYEIHKNCGTSLQMIQKYYDHVKTKEMKHRLSR